MSCALKSFGRKMLVYFTDWMIAVECDEYNNADTDYSRYKKDNRLEVSRVVLAILSG